MRLNRYLPDLSDMGSQIFFVQRVTHPTRATVSTALLGVITITPAARAGFALGIRLPRVPAA